MQLTRVFYSLVWLTCVCTCTASFAQSQADSDDQRILLTQAREPQPRLDARIVSMPKVQKKMEIILNRSQLVQTRDRVTRMAIADPTIIDIAPFEEDEFAIIGTAIGSTTLTLWFEGDKNPLIYEVTVIRDPNIEEQIRIDYGKLERKIALLFPNSKVYLIPLHEKLIVKGQAKDGAEASRILQIVRDSFLDDQGGLYGPGSGNDRGGDAGLGGNDFNDPNRNFGNDDLFSSFIVNMLQVPGEFQVMLHVTIAELNHSQSRSMGVNLNVLFSDGRNAIASTLAGGIPTLTGIFENGDVTAIINALASNGTAKILSRPSLTTLSGYPAQFLAGGEFAVPTTVGIGGVQGATTQFRGFGTSMVVIPTIIDGDLIRMQIAPEFSQINSNNAVGGIPGLDSRRVQTTVELREGQTIALGGLLSRQTATEVSRIPLLGEIPFFGPILFNSKRSTEDELELLVLVTPEIVRAMDPDEVPPMPGYYVTHPNDRELYRYAMTEGAPDLEVYQLAPYGNKVGYPNPVGFNVYNPSPATPQYGPIPQANQPNGYPTPSPWTEQSQQYGGTANGMTISPSQIAPSMNDPMYNQQMMAPPQMQMAPQGQNYGQPYQAPMNGQPMMNNQPLNNQPMLQAPSMQPSPQYMPPPAPGSYQQAPPALQGYPMRNQAPNSGNNSYRGGVPTANNNMQYRPNYNEQLFAQPAGQNRQSTLPPTYNGNRVQPAAYNNRPMR